MKFFDGKNSGTGIVLAVAWAGMLVQPELALSQTNGSSYYPGLEQSYDLTAGSTIEPIDTANGNNYFTEERISVPCPVVSLVVDLKYQSITSHPEGCLGKGWFHSYDWSLDIQASQAVLYTGSGEKKVFLKDAGGEYLSPESNNWTLEEVAIGYEMDMPGGMAYIFNTNGILTAIHDAWGNGVTCSYGTNDCLETVTHANGRQVVFSNAWNAAIGKWRVASIAVQNGESLSFAYNGDGQFTQVVEQVDSTTYTSSYQYADGFLTNKVNGAGFEYSFEYGTDPSGTLNGKGIALEVDGYYEHAVTYDVGISDVTYFRRGEEQIFRYVRNGSALTEKYGPAESIQNIQQRGIRYGYATSKGIDKTEETLFDNIVNETSSEWMLYDDAHNITNYSVSYCTTNPVHRRSTEYDQQWQLPSAIVDAEGFRSETIYTNGSPFVEKAFYSASNSYDTCYSYTTNGFLRAVTNANGHVVRHGYDSLGNRISSMDELGPITTNTYDALGFVQSTEILSESGVSTERITQYARDAKGRILQTVFADGSTNSFAYNALGYRTNKVDCAGRSTDYTYAPTKKLTSVTQYLVQGGSNVPVCIAYDLDKQLNTLHITEPRGRYVESYLLDIQDRIVAVTNIEGQVMSTDYGVGDFVRKTTRFDGSWITNQYDNAGQLTNATYSGGTAIAYSYWPDGESKTVSDGFSSISNAYDRLNRLTNQVAQVGNLQPEIDNAFDPVGNLTNTEIQVSGFQFQVSRTYDAAERLTGILQHEGTETQNFVYAYSPVNGLVESVSNTVSGITCSYEYDLMDRVTNMVYKTASGSLIRSLGYEYDAVGMITKKRIDGGGLATETDYVYDSLDRLVYESQSGSASSAYSVVYSYDLAGNRTAKTSDGWKTTYSLGDGNRLASSTTALSSTNTLFVSGTANEPIGTNPLWGEIWITNLTTGAGAIPSVNGKTFFAEVPALGGQTNTLHVAIPDKAGNMGYATHDFWVPSATGGTPASSSYAYNEAGCLTNLNGVSLGWDERYRLTVVTTATAVVSYEYDVLNRRVSRTAGFQPATVERYVYNGKQIIADLDISGNLLRTFVWGQGIDNLLSMTVYESDGGVASTNTYYAIKDHQNTVIALVDSSGSVVESYEYSAYGETKVFNASGSELAESALGNRYCFQGREIDWMTGLYYFRARWYDPGTGRWLSKDTIGIEGGLNQYVFCGNNPVNNTDPNGTWVNVAAGAVWGAITGAISGFSAGLASGGGMNAAVAGGAIGAATGAVVGAATALVNPAAVGAVAGAVGGAAGSMLVQAMAGNDINAGAVVGATVGGALTGLAGNALAGQVAAPAAAKGVARGIGQMMASPLAGILSETGRRIGKPE